MAEETTPGAEIAHELRSALQGEVRFDLYSRLLYSTDASNYQIMPIGVVLPRAADEVAAAVEICARHGVPVLPRGAGSSLGGQAVGAAVHIDFSKYLCRLLEINVEERWARVEPGLSGDALNRELKPHGLIFGPDPASSERATAGGILGNNAAGAHSILYGVTADHVRAARAVLSDGSLADLAALDEAGLQRKLEAGGLEGQIYRESARLVREHRQALRTRYPRTWRRASGYSLNYLLPPPERLRTRPPGGGVVPEDDGFNLARLLAGAEGTLAVATEITFDLVPRPRQTALDIVHFDDLIAAADATLEVLQCGPSAVEVIDDTIIDLARGVPAYGRMMGWVQGQPRAVLAVEFYGENDAELAGKLAQLEARLRAKGIARTFVRATTAQQQADVWGVRKEGLGLLMSVRGDRKPLAFVEDVAVPVERLGEYLRATQRIFARHHLRSAVYAHASAGCLHIRPMISLKTADGVATMRAVAEEIFAEVMRLDGAMSGEHGDGLSRGEFNARHFGPELYGAFRELKRAWDPRGLLNPGKVVDCPPLDANLRYGADYRAEQPPTRMDFTLEGGLAGAVEQCNGAAVCRKAGAGTMCPSYMATREERHSTRGRANMLRAALSGRLPREDLYGAEMYETFDLCLECKACKAECPSAVDIAKVKFEWLTGYQAEHGTPLRTRLFAGIHKLSMLGSASAPLSNWALGSVLARGVLARVGIDARRTLPAFARMPFERWFRARQAPPADGRPRVVLFHDTFTNYNCPEVGRAAVQVLESAGYAVEIVPRQGCCGRPMISKGRLDQARATLDYSVGRLAPYAEQGIPVVGLEPSCILTFRDEAIDLLKGDGRARIVGQNTFLIEEFLLHAMEEDRWPPQGQTAGRGAALVHGHCHQKALAGAAPLLRVLRAAGYDATEADAGCCGMAGAFGYEHEHYDISMTIAEERLFPAIRAAGPDAIIIAPGFSCRQQIAHGTGRRAVHPAEALAGELRT